VIVSAHVGRRATLLALVLALGAGAPARAESVAGTTTIAASRAGAIPVHLDRALRFDEGSLPSARFTGKGDWRALALIGEHGMLGAMGTDDSTFVGTSSELPAGDYRLLIATDDGVPLTATLTLPGLEGSVALAPTSTLPLHLARPAAWASPSFPDTTVIGAVARTHGGGMGADALSIRYAPASGGRSQHCYVFGDEASEDDFDAGCPDDFDDVTPAGSPFVTTSDEPGEPWRTFWFGQDDAFGEGANVTAEGGAPTLSETARWIDFGDQGEPIPAPAAPPVAAPPAPAPAPVAAPTLRCPTVALRLPRAFRSAAARAALAHRRGLRAIAGRAAGADAQRIAAACGRRVLARTAVVRLRGRGLTETAYLVRTRRGWRVWRTDRRQLG